MPYSQALDIDNISPAYDDAQTIYADLFTRLDAAIASIDVAFMGFKEGDLVYYGDMAKWRTFAYSLKLKMAITVADIAALNPGGNAANVFASSGANATFTYLGESPNTNPIWVDLVASGRYDWVVANTLIDKMKTLNDPRLPLYCEQNLGAGVYTGGIYGDNNSYSSYTHITGTIQVPDWRGLLMSYSEVQFYLAEAATRGFIAGSADGYYNEAIRASIVDDWGGTAGDATTYLADPNVAFPTGGTTDAKLDAIATQSWIASYDRGLIGWTTWRRLDAPTFNLPALTGSPVPNRYTYPAVEQTLNGGNYTSASSAIGGDTQASKIFWDKF